jgi:serine/threonine protein kinase/TolB-like protein/Flp pilus assembly protein TadD
MFSERENRANLSGVEISHYRIKTLLGRGGMGEVYLAEDTRLDRRVALKILPPEFAADKNRMSRFVREAKSASALNHPNIITIYEIGVGGDTHFIATEYIDGKTLSEYVGSGSLDFAAVLDIAIQIASALTEAHAAGIVHRDIKPDNIMIRRKDGLVKVLDFGLAKLAQMPDQEAKTIIKSAFNDSPSTSPGIIMGTPNYMSPEQARGREIDRQTDIFSFGVVFYEMLSGSLPFTGETTSDIIASILVKEPKPLSETNGEMSAELEEIVKKALCKDKQERYQTARDLLTDLKNFRQDFELRNRFVDKFPAYRKEAKPEKLKNAESVEKITPPDEISKTPNNLSSEFSPLTGRESEVSGGINLSGQPETGLLTVTGVGATEKTLLSAAAREINYNETSHSASPSAAHITDEIGQNTENYSTKDALEAQTAVFEPVEPRTPTVSRKGNFLSKLRGKQFFAAVLIFFTLAGGFLGYLYFAPEARGIESIAVMPFVNEGGNADAEYLTDGMTETLIRSLAQLPKLNVKARSSVFRYKGRETNLQTIGRELNVEAILNGRVVQRGEWLTLSLELVDVETENVIWSEQYYRRQSDLVSLQSEIARDVSVKLKTRLSGADERKLTKKYTEDPEAFHLYLKGRYFWNKRTQDAYRQAADFFQQAIDRDPTYAPAYVGLADARAFLRVRGQSGRGVYRQAKDIVQRAIEIDNTLGEAFTTMAMLTQNADWDWENAEKQYRRAIELSPNYATAHHWYGELLVQMGRIEEGIAHHQRALEIDPLSRAISSDLGLSYYYARQYDRAIGQLQKTIEMDPNFFRTYFYRARIYEHLGQYEKAVADYRQGLLLVGENPARVAQIAAEISQSLTVSGERGYWQKRLEIKQRNPELRVEWECDLASIRARLGDRDQAFASLENAFQERLFDVLFLKVAPEFDALRGDARFQDLTRRVGLPQ